VIFVVRSWSAALPSIRIFNYTAVRSEKNISTKSTISASATSIKQGRAACLGILETGALAAAFFFIFDDPIT
jgi:hypothetical protein